MTLYDDASAAIQPGGTDLRVGEALEIVRAYGEVLESGQREGPGAADTSALPYPKDSIKWALLVVMGAIGEPARRERLKAAFVALAEWQTHADFTQGFDSTRLRKRLDPLALAKEFAELRTPEDRWRAAARDEQATLIVELKRRGFW